ncbi:hypothetical protein AR687_14780 [Flavobacteriaceae bacterium CRH]|nr:hypothetical protein AR687_14780 [Flavobacteriaceae bacterium CRH]
MNEYLKSLYLSLKENLTMFAVIPTVLGGIWQMTKLLSLSTNLMRFFSITQLISDGILVLIIIIFPILLFSIFFISPKNNIKNSEETLFNKDYLFGYFPIILNLIFMVLILTIWLKLYQYITIDTLGVLISVIPSIAIVVAFLYFIIEKYITKDKIILQLFLVLCTIIYTLTTLIAFNNISKNLTGIINFEKLINKIEKDHCYSKKPEILYFNDKYIFIELENKNKKSILIKTIDSLFEE